MQLVSSSTVELNRSIRLLSLNSQTSRAVNKIPLKMWSSFVFVSLSVVMIQTGFTEGQQQPNNVGFVHPIATDVFPVNHPTVEQQQPTEEDLTSTEPSTAAAQQQPVKPQFQVPVTLPFVMQRPQKPAAVVGKPSSYLRPIIMVDPVNHQDELPIRQTKPWNLPQVEDLSSPPPGVAVTLPIRAKPTSYLRPVFVVDEMNDDEPSYYVPTKNVAVTLPFDLRPENPVLKSKPVSYLRPVIVPTDAVDELTPEGDYEEEEEDLTSPAISGPVQPSPPNINAVAIPYIQQQQPVKASKPASYLRPWFVDDSSTYNAPVRAAAATKPWSTKEVAVDDSTAGYYQRRPATVPYWLAYRTGSPVVKMRDSNYVRPLVYRQRPISVSFTLY